MIKTNCDKIITQTEQTNIINYYNTIKHIIAILKCRHWENSQQQRKIIAHKQNVGLHKVSSLKTTTKQTIFAYCRGGLTFLNVKR